MQVVPLLRSHLTFDTPLQLHGIKTIHTTPLLLGNVVEKIFCFKDAGKKGPMDSKEQDCRPRQRKQEEENSVMSASPLFRGIAGKVFFLSDPNALRRIKEFDISGKSNVVMVSLVVDGSAEAVNLGQYLRVEGHPGAAKAKEIYELTKLQ